MVTPFQAVSTTVPKSVVVAPHRTRSPTLRSRDCSPVIETPSNDESTCNVARPGDSRRIHLLSRFQVHRWVRRSALAVISVADSRCKPALGGYFSLRWLARGQRLLRACAGRFYGQSEDRSGGWMGPLRPLFVLAQRLAPQLPWMFLPCGFRADLYGQKPDDLSGPAA